MAFAALTQSIVRGARAVVRVLAHRHAFRSRLGLTCLGSLGRERTAHRAASRGGADSVQPGPVPGEPGAVAGRCRAPGNGCGSGSARSARSAPLAPEEAALKKALQIAERTMPSSQQAGARSLCRCRMGVSGGLNPKHFERLDIAFDSREIQA